MTEENVVNLSDRRHPVTYTITVTHYWTGQLGVFVAGVADDPASQLSVNDAIARIATSRMTMRHIHMAMLARIDQLMTAEKGSCDARELSVLADACVILEKEMFPSDAGK